MSTYKYLPIKNCFYLQQNVVLLEIFEEIVVGIKSGIITKLRKQHTNYENFLLVIASIFTFDDFE